MVFEIEGKVALVTGGAGGIGLCCVKALLKHGLKGVAILDINEELGRKALEELKAEYGAKRAIFVGGDVSDKNVFSGAFTKTVKTFNNLDILVNNAGFFNERMQDRVLAVNLNAVITGTYLAMEHFLLKYRSGPEGVVINVASIAGIGAFPGMPVYTSTKFGVVGLTKAFGDEVHYKRTKVRVVAICPGATLTSILLDSPSKTLSKHYADILEEGLKTYQIQEPASVASGLVTVIQKAKPGTIWVAEDGNRPYEFVEATKESCKL